MSQARILLIFDDREMAGYLRDKLAVNAGYSVSFESEAHSAIEAFKDKSFDIVILKFGIPGLDNAELIKGFKKIDPDCVIIAFLEDENSLLIKDIPRMGVYDFIARPIDLEKLFFLIRKGAELHGMTSASRKQAQSVQEQNLALQRQNTLLAKRIEESTKNLTRLYEDLRSTYMRTIKVLAQAIDARDHYTHSHSQNVAKYAVSISEELRLSGSEIDLIRDACELHDLGKIGVVDNILSKPSALTAEEREQIQKHPITAAQILEPLTFLNNVIELVKQHHENYDGSGYPEGLRGEKIALGARIIHVADAYEAMTSARAYRKEPFSKEEAVLEIKNNSGTQFDPQVVEAFLKVVDTL